MRYVRVQNNKVVEIGDFSQDPNGVLFNSNLVWVRSDTAQLNDIYDGVNFTPDLSTAKANKNLQINQWREQANFSSFTWQAKQIACDSLSRSDIDGVMGYIALNNALPVGWPGGWKAIDNTFLSIPDVATFNSMYQAMVSTGTANFTHSQNLKTSVANALTVADVNAIVW